MPERAEDVARYLIDRFDTKELRSIYNALGEHLAGQHGAKVTGKRRKAALSC